MSLFKTYKLFCIKIFVEKPNWKPVLNYLAQGALKNQFFFFFDTERGQHLTIFAEKLSSETISEVQNFVNTLPRLYTRQHEDFLFTNFSDKTIIRLHKISQSNDIEIPAEIADAIGFQKKLANVILGALNYNDFFLEEKNRINLALQLVFLAMVRAKKSKILASVSKMTELGSVDMGLKSLYDDIQNIENEGDIERWVRDWIEISETIQSVSFLEHAVESICQILEIRTFSKNILLTLYSLLASSNVRTA